METVKSHRDKEVSLSRLVIPKDPYYCLQVTMPLYFFHWRVFESLPKSDVLWFIFLFFLVIPPKYPV